MLQSWRWFGPNDPVMLDHVKQAGASGVVSALHHIYDGRAWTPEDIAERKAMIEATGLQWAVCESIPVQDSIKLRSGSYRQYIDNWKTSLANLGRGGVPMVCYNFMPVVDWTRTDLLYRMPTTGYALRFDMAEFVAYDVLVLKRPNAEKDYPAELLHSAKARLSAMSESEIATLEKNIIAGLPGGEDSYDRAGIARRIAEFDELGADDMRANLQEFIREIAPVAEDVNVKLGIHPDDPPFSLFGLPRVVSTADDLRSVLDAYKADANGLTFCTGSLGSRRDNAVVAIAEEFASRINFVHLRNVSVEDDKSFNESEHLGGDVNMVDVIHTLRKEEHRREAAGRTDSTIPMRPDHGHLLADDITKKTNPGYSLIGRLKGLAELRGIITAVDQLAPS
ncbi:mannonate dehydratase [Mesorhizobium sp. RP14(2022)]|uniref:Mannonate dehydratase n=1 Tax=Mesorhizobium liriopis TaxID=2953882 RepID=A0ABT1C7B7_9HYPH|nr:mannonate dehydratase [Mesorhizobium liriopis]MCO6050056.1 mannonate dehydratase [Mesorhizobium liriopis]